MQSAAILLFFFPMLASGDEGISVFGHKSPDTDTVTSAIAYAWELNERGIPATAFRLGELNPETKFVLKKLKVETPPFMNEVADKSSVAVVDTNNPAELPDNLSKATLHSIVDHHKLSGLANSEPLEIDMRPLCSATSILYSRAKEHSLTIPPNIAGLMLAGILSDSLEFRSPTTTELDKVHAAELGKLANLNVTEFADKMLEAKANVDHLGPGALIDMDTKVFKIGKLKLRVSVLETTKPKMVIKKHSDLLGAAIYRKDRVEPEVDDILFFVIDILKEEAVFMTFSGTGSEIVEKAFGVKVEKGLAVIPGVLSRKKQIIPKLEAAAKDEL